MTYGTLNNRIDAEKIVGKLETEQAMTLEDLVHIGSYFGMVQRITTEPSALHFGGKVELELAPSESLYKGRYTYTVEITVYQDGTFDIMGADEPFVDEIEQTYTYIEATSDQFLRSYKR